VTDYASELSSWRRQQGQFVARGGGARGGARSGSGGGDLAVEARWGTESATHSASSEVGVGGLLCRARSSGEEIRREKDAATLNFEGVQTFGRKFHNFTKNLPWHHLQYYKFRLTHYIPNLKFIYKW
jgi:hypothetical protein